MNKKMDKILAEISAGELIDKITILEIKEEKISNKEKLVEVRKELSSLNETLKKSINDESKIINFKNDLKKINILNEFSSPDNAVVVELILEEDSHHHHLFCSDCGEVIDVELSDEFEMMLVKEMEKVQKELNFEIKDHRVEMFGLCTDECSNCN